MNEFYKFVRIVLNTEYCNLINKLITVNIKKTIYTPKKLPLNSLNKKIIIINENQILIFGVTSKKTYDYLEIPLIEVLGYRNQRKYSLNNCSK